MKAVVNAKELSTACAMARKVIGNKGKSFPILSHIMLCPNGEKVVVKASNFEVLVEYTIKAKCDGDDPVLIPAREAYEFIKREAGDVTIDSDPKTPTVKLISNGGEQNAVLTLETSKDKDQFPSLSYEMPPTIELSEAFLPTLKIVQVYTSEDTVRPILNTVFLQSEGNEGQFNIVAADGFRLAQKKLYLDLPKFEANVPLDTCKLMTQHMEGNVTMGIHEPDAKYGATFAQFVAGNITIKTTLCQGTFPKYQQLIPDAKPTWEFTTSGPLLYQRLTQFIAETGITRFTNQDGNLKLTMGLSDGYGGAFESVLPAKMEGDGKWAANQKYIAEIAKVFAEMTVKTTAHASPCVVTGDVADLLMVVMPMFVQW